VDDLEKKFYTIAFKAEINDRAEEIDSSNEQDWFSLTLGWAIGKGLTPEDAHEFARYIRYETPLG
jgi:hypothetical protein